MNATRDTLNLVIENELFRIQDSPEDVVQRFSWISLAVQRLEQIFQFIRLRLAAVATEIKMFDHLLGRFALSKHLFYETTFENLVVGRLTVQQMKRLRKCWLNVDLAGTDGLAWSTTKRGENSC